MIKQFSKKILFAPRSWLNAVARWIAGVYSPDGTISVRNTLNPGEDGSLALSVNMDVIAAKVKERLGLDKRSLLDRNDVRDIIADMVDGGALVVCGNRVTVNSEWIAAQTDQSAGVQPADTDPADVGAEALPGTAVTVSRSDHVHKLAVPSATSATDLGGGVQSGSNVHGTIAGTVTDGCGGFTFMMACSIGYGNITSRLYFRPVTVGDDGRILSLGAATDSLLICTDV